MNLPGRIPARPALVESLESRRLLAADLAVLAASTTNLASNGSHTGNITLKNTGTTPLTGRVDITFIAIARGKANQILGTATVTLSKLKTNAAKTVNKIALKTPKNAGNKSQVFNIVARITPHTSPADTAAGNNEKTAGTFRIKASVTHKA